jgi:uncharacterized Rossmann fold enzyme
MKLPQSNFGNLVNSHQGDRNQARIKDQATRENHRALESSLLPEQHRDGPELHEAQSVAVVDNPPRIKDSISAWPVEAVLAASEAVRSAIEAALRPLQ